MTALDPATGELVAVVSSDISIFFGETDIC
jgi:hypothetical protein